MAVAVDDGTDHHAAQQHLNLLCEGGGIAGGGAQVAEQGRACLAVAGDDDSSASPSQHFVPLHKAAQIRRRSPG